MSSIHACASTRNSASCSTHSTQSHHVAPRNDGAVFDWERLGGRDWWAGRVLADGRAEREGLEPWELAQLEHVLKRLGKMHDCGARVGVRACEACGEFRPGTGDYRAAFHKTCQARVCPRCAWTRAMHVYDFFRTAVPRVLEVEGYTWQFLVFTSRYDPRDPAALTWQALRARALGVARIVSEVWRRELRVDGAGVFRAVEVSVRGHVHANVLYYGPTVAVAKLEAVARTVGRGLAGSIHCQPAHDAKRDIPLAEQVARQARYMSKGIEGSWFAFDEGWISNERSVMGMSPKLAARWEIATFRVPLVARYGILRGFKLETDEGMRELAREQGQVIPNGCEPNDDAHRPDDSEVACPHCGVVGEWRTVSVPTVDYLQWCHRKGFAGMRHSSWKPPWERTQGACGP